MNTTMYPEPMELLKTEKCVLDMFKTKYDIYKKVLHLSNSGVELDTIKNNVNDFMDIDDPPDPLDEEDPFNPYNFI